MNKNTKLFINTIDSLASTKDFIVDYLKIYMTQ